MVDSAFPLAELPPGRLMIRSAVSDRVPQTAISIRRLRLRSAICDSAPLSAIGFLRLFFPSADGEAAPPLVLPLRRLRFGSFACVFCGFADIPQKSRCAVKCPSDPPERMGVP